MMMKWKPKISQSEKL